MKILALIFLCCVGFINDASAQNCPMPYFEGQNNNTQFYINLPVPEGLPANGAYNFYQMYIWGSPSVGVGGFGFASSGLAIPDGDYSSTGNVQPILYDRDSLQQAYLVDVSYNSATSRFEKQPVYVVNRFRRATGEDRLVIGRFHATNPNDNFLFTMPLVQDNLGNFDLNQPIACQRTTSVQRFNAAYMNVGVRKPAISVIQFGEYFGADFHNSLYPNKLCTGVLCPKVLPCPDC